MPDAQETQPVLVVPDEGAEFAVSLNEDQLRALVQAVAEQTRQDNGAYAALLSAVEESGGANPAFLSAEQYEGLMTATTANSVGLVVVVALLFVIIGVMLGRILTNRWDV